MKGNKEQWVLIMQHSGLSNWLDIKIRSMNLYFLKLLKEQICKVQFYFNERQHVNYCLLIRAVQ